MRTLIRTTPTRRPGRRLTLAASAVAVTYFMDPDEGARRRAMARDRIAATFRRGSRKAREQALTVGGKAESVVKTAAHPQGSQEPVTDDVTLARKVETEIFRDPDVPKGQISVNAEHGKVVLRGEVPSAAQAERLESQARAIPGVTEVENLLHPPGTPAPASTPHGPDAVREQAGKPRAGSRFGESQASSAPDEEPAA